MSSKEWIELDRDFKGKLPLKGQVRDGSEGDWIDATLECIHEDYEDYPYINEDNIGWQQARVLKEDYDKSLEGLHLDENNKGVKTMDQSDPNQRPVFVDGVCNVHHFGLTEEQAIEALQAKADEVKKESEKGWWLCRHNETEVEVVLFFDGSNLKESKKAFPFRDKGWTRLNKMVEKED